MYYISGISLVLVALLAATAILLGVLYGIQLPK